MTFGLEIVPMVWDTLHLLWEPDVASLTAGCLGDRMDVWLLLTAFLAALFADTVLPPWLEWDNTFVTTVLFDLFIALMTMFLLCVLVTELPLFELAQDFSPDGQFTLTMLGTGESPLLLRVLITTASGLVLCKFTKSISPFTVALEVPWSNDTVDPFDTSNGPLENGSWTGLHTADPFKDVLSQSNVSTFEALEIFSSMESSWSCISQSLWTTGATDAIGFVWSDFAGSAVLALSVALCNCFWAKYLAMLVCNETTAVSH